MPMPILSRVLVKADSIDLTDLATIKEELSLKTADTSKDAFLTRAITQISKAIESYCKRTFAVETVRDSFAVDVQYQNAYGLAFDTPSRYMLVGGARRNVIQLSRYPVLDLPITVLAPSQTLSGATLPFTDTSGIAIGQPVSHASVLDGTVVASFVANASVTLSGSLTAPVNAGDSVTFGLTVSTSDQFAHPDTRKIITSDQFEVDQEAGQLRWHGASMDALTLICYRAGYLEYPADLVDAALRALTNRFASRGRDPLMRTQNQPILGTETYWIGSAPGQRGGFSGEIADMLENYVAA
jgi:hypothetical protein